jgi:hypothetical protein
VNLLASSITGTVASVTAPVFMPNGFFGITNFFFPANVPVQAGVEYFFRPVLQSGNNTGLLAGQYSYAGGTAIFSGVPSSIGLDFNFREGIVVPEPTSGGFVLMGVLVTFLFQRKPSWFGFVRLTSQSCLCWRTIWIFSLKNLVPPNNHLPRLFVLHWNGTNFVKRASISRPPTEWLKGSANYYH